MTCYKSGGCGVYENRPCNECPASKPSYMLDSMSIYVSTIEGENKDNYMAIGFSEKESKENVMKAFFEREDDLKEEYLEEYGCRIVTTCLSTKHPYICY